jgi:hypothetical protein
LVAAPFRLDYGCHLTGLDATFDTIGSPQELRYVIWKRRGLDQPTSADLCAAGSFGPIGPGIDDPRIKESKTFPLLDDFLHQQRFATPLTLPAGDYYLSIYTEGGSGSYLRWLTGATGQDESLEQAWIWRTWAYPGSFFEYAPTTLRTFGGVEADDRWNPSFTLYGIHAPEPSLAAALAGMAGTIAAMAIAKRVRANQRKDTARPDPRNR